MFSIPSRPFGTNHKPESSGLLGIPVLPVIVQWSQRTQTRSRYQYGVNQVHGVAGTLRATLKQPVCQVTSWQPTSGRVTPMQLTVCITATSRVLTKQAGLVPEMPVFDQSALARWNAAGMGNTSRPAPGRLTAAAQAWGALPRQVGHRALQRRSLHLRTKLDRPLCGGRNLIRKLFYRALPRRIRLTMPKSTTAPTNETNRDGRLKLF